MTPFKVIYKIDKNQSCSDRAGYRKPTLHPDSFCSKDFCGKSTVPLRYSENYSLRNENNIIGIM